MTKSELFPCFCKGFFDFIKSLNKKRFLDKGVDRDPIHFGVLFEFGAWHSPVNALDWGESPRPLIPSLPMSRKFLKLGEVTAIFLPRREPAQRVLKSIKWYQEWH